MHGARRRPLGRLPLQVSTLGVGGGSLAVAGEPQETDAMLCACWEAGLRYFDTAPLYGQSEQRLGLFLNRLSRDDYVISTKVGRYPAPPGQRRFDFSVTAVERSITESLRRLRINFLDLIFLHDLSPAMLGADFERTRDIVLSETLPYLSKLKRQGVIRAIGLAQYDCDAAANMLSEARVDCVMVAGGYTLLCQDALHALLPLCESRGIGVLMASPFHTGLLVSGAVNGARYNYQKADVELLNRVRLIQQICNRYAIELPSAALQFPLLHPAIVAVVAGHKTAAEVRANTAWLEPRIPMALWKELIHYALIPPTAPLSCAERGN
jgi:D-threo-aldose 1-dehydrogenase